MSTYESFLLLLAIWASTHCPTSADDVADSHEDASSYFESFFAQTADWGDFDVEIECSTLIEEVESTMLSESLVKERYIRIGDKKTFVQSLRLAPISGDESAKPSHRITVTVLSDGVARQRAYPERTPSRFEMDENRTFEWVCNPPDFRLLGVVPFPCRGGAIDERMVESLRKKLCVPNPAISLEASHGKVVISKTDRRPDMFGQWTFVFDVDRLLLTERQWRVEGGKNLVSGSESYVWKKIDTTYRPIRIIGDRENSVHKNGELVKVKEMFDARYKWNELDENATANQDELLSDATKALEFLESSKDSDKVQRP